MAGKEIVRLAARPFLLPNYSLVCCKPSLVPPPPPPQTFNRGFGFKSGLSLVGFVPSLLRQVDVIDI